MNLADFLANTVRRMPDHPAIRFEKKTVTFSEMNRRVDALNISICRGLTSRMWSGFSTQKVPAAIVEEENTVLYVVPIPPLEIRITALTAYQKESQSILKFC